MVTVCKIYGLCDPDTKEIRYVGQTIKSLHDRLRRHICEAQKGKISHLWAWIRKLLNEDKKPIMTLLKDNAEWNIDEIKIIKQMRLSGADLVNSTDGGQGLQNQSEETKEKRVLSRSWYRHSEETKTKISLSHKGKKQPHKQKRSIEASIKISNRMRSKSKLSAEDITHIRNLYNSSQYKYKDLASKFGISKSTVGQIIRGQTWKDYQGKDV